MIMSLCILVLAATSVYAEGRAVPSLKSNISISEIEPENEALYLEQYGEEKIAYQIWPQNATNKNVRFQSLNTAVATVDENGWVYGKRPGNTRIKIMAQDGQAQAYIKVYVTEEESSDTKIRSIAILHENETVKDTFEIMEKETVSFEIRAYPRGVSNDVTWRSLDTDIAVVDSNGKVTGKRVGTCKIQAISKVNSARKCTVTIKVTEYIKYPDSISIAPGQDSVFCTGNTVLFTPTFYPADTTEKKLKWSVDRGGSIDQNGRLIILDSGKIKVQAYSENYKTKAEYVINAVYSANHFSLAGDSYNLRPSRKIEIYFSSEVNRYAANQNIFATADEQGNGEKIPLEILTEKNRVVISAVNGWQEGENYIFIKDTIQDTAGNTLGMNLKYKIHVRSAGNET